MMLIPFLSAILALSAQAVEPPFFNREVKNLQDVGALNQNSRALADGIRKSDLTNGGTVDGSVTVDEICFSADATCQTTADDTSTIINASTQAWSVALWTLSAGAAAGPEFVGCNVFSTMTLTTDAVAVRFNFIGATHVNVGGEGCHAYFLADGALVAPLTGTLGWGLGAAANSGEIVPFNLSIPTQSSLSAGSHEFCVGIANDNNGACHLDCDTKRCFFEVREDH